MGKKIILGIILFLGIFHITWYAGSCTYKNRGLPDNVKEKDYQVKLLKRMDIKIDTRTMEETDIDANGFRIHLTVFPAGKKAPTLVFIPGTSVYARFYIEFLYDMYRQGFNVVGFDPR